jgi:hypothetical protein
MSTTYWDALLHLNHGCAIAALQLRRDGRALEFAIPQHSEREILINEALSGELRRHLASGCSLLAEAPLATDGTTAWRDDDCRQLIEQTMPTVEKFCGELQSRHDSLRDENGAHPMAIEHCSCEMSRLHHVLVNAVEYARSRLLR